MAIIRENVAEDFYSLWKEALVSYVDTIKDHPTLKELLVQWEWQHGRPKNIESIKKVVDYVLMHKSSHNKKHIIKEVMVQAMFHGSSFVMSAPNPLCEEFIQMNNEVKRDIENTTRNARMIRFNNTVVLDISPEHNIGVIVCEFLKEKFPYSRIIVINKKKAHLYDDYYTEINFSTKEELFHLFHLDKSMAIPISQTTLDF